MKQEVILHSPCQQLMVDLQKHAVNLFAKQTFSKAKESLGIEDGSTASGGSNGAQEGPINW